jgi:hypothetical protein
MSAAPARNAEPAQVDEVGRQRQYMNASSGSGVPTDDHGPRGRYKGRPAAAETTAYTPRLARTMLTDAIQQLPGVRSTTSRTRRTKVSDEARARDGGITRRRPSAMVKKLAALILVEHAPYAVLR